MDNKLISLTSTRSIVDDTGTMNQESRTFFANLVARIPAMGEGTPENVIASRKGSTYYDLAASIGSIHYVKMVDSVDGDDSRGWEIA